MKTIILDGITWELPYHDLLPPLPEALYQELKGDIADKGGNIYPVIWTPSIMDGFPLRRVVVDGGHRLRAVSELRGEGHDFELSEQCLHFASLDEERQAALDLNTKRRQLTQEQRQEAVLRLRREGKSTRQIAEVVGVDPKTVRNDLKVSGGDNSPPATVTGMDGKTYPANRPSPSPAGEHQAPRLSISTSEERATISGPALYDEAVARKAERDDAAEIEATRRHYGIICEEATAAPGDSAPALPAPIGIKKGGLTDAQRAELAESVEASFAKSGPLCPVTLLPSEAPAVPAPGEAPEVGAEYDDEASDLRNEVARLKEELARVTKKKAHVGNASGEEEWYTPIEIINAAREVMGCIDLDPASCATANEKVGASRYFTKEEDGPAQEWRGNVWMNPPYAAVPIARFAKKLREEFEAGRVSSAVVLVNNATETKWFADFISCASAVCFPGSRVHFWHPDRPDASPLQGQAILYLGPSRESFEVTFSRFGWVAFIVKNRGAK